MRNDAEMSRKSLAKFHLKNVKKQVKPLSVKESTSLPVTDSKKIGGVGKKKPEPMKKEQNNTISNKQVKETGSNLSLTMTESKKIQEIEVSPEKKKQVQIKDIKEGESSVDRLENR